MQKDETQLLHCVYVFIFSLLFAHGYSDDYPKIDTGLTIRSRVESFDNFLYTDSLSDTYFLYHVKPNARVSFNDRFSVFGELIHANITDRDLPRNKRTVDVDTFDIQNLYLEYSDETANGAAVIAKLGRQSFSFGRQRLVSPLPWVNTGNKWDGISTEVKGGSITSTLFWGGLVPVQKFEFNSPSLDDQLFGIYTNFSDRIDAYYIGRDRNVRTSHTIGVRIFDDREINTGVVIDFDCEAAWQFGDAEGDDVEAYMVGLEAGVRWEDRMLKPRLFVGFDLGSGDGDAADSTVSTFDQLNPLAHAYLGYADSFGRQNIVDYSFGFEGELVAGLTFRGAFHFLEKHRENDFIYGANGSPLPIPISGRSDLGEEIDLTLKWELENGVTSTFGYSRVLAGDELIANGRDQDIDFGYAMFSVTF